MEKVEDIYDFILKTRFEYWIEDVLKDIKIIEFAILCQNVEYKKNIYNKKDVNPNIISLNILFFIFKYSF